MSSRAEGNTVTIGNTGSKSVVQNERSFDLFGVSHTTGQSLGVAAGEAVVQVIFHGFLSDGEAHRNGFVVVTCSPSFLRIVISNGSALVLHRSGGEARQLGFLFKATLRGFGLVDFLVLLAVLGVLKAEQSVQAGEQFFQQLCA